jgi:hypothetical protein
MIMTLRKTCLAIALGLTVAPSAALADSATGDLLLTRSACSGASDVLGLSYDGGAYSGSCGSVPGVQPVTDTYASETLPLPVTLDTARKVHIDIVIDSFVGSPIGSIGDETVGVDLTGTTTKNKGVPLGSAEAVKPAAEMLTAGSYVQSFDLDLSKVPATNVYKSFSLDLTVGGSVAGGFVNIGKSVVQVPVFDDAILVPSDEEE